MRNRTASSVPTIIVLFQDIHVHTQSLHSKWETNGVGRREKCFYHSTTDHKWGQFLILKVSEHPPTGDIFLAPSPYLYSQPLIIQLALSFLLEPQDCPPEAPRSSYFYFANSLPKSLEPTH